MSKIKHGLRYDKKPQNASEHRAENINNKILIDIIYPIVGKKTTNGGDLENVCKMFLGNKFNGVYPSDMIPRLTNHKKYAILNLDDSTQGGSHWVAIAKMKNNVMLFDSYGRKGAKIIPYLGKSGNGTVINVDEDADQKINEKNCGARCIAWLLLYDLWGSKMARLL